MFIPTSVKDWGAREGSQEVMGVAVSDEGAAMSLSTGHETENHCRVCGIAMTANPNAKSRRAVWASTVTVSGVPQAVETAEESAEGIADVSNKAPHEIQKTKTRVEAPSSTSHVGNQAPHSESETPQAHPGEVQYHLFDGVTGNQVNAGAVHLKELPEVSVLLNSEETSMKCVLTELKPGEIEDTSPED
ncbi:Pol protein [Phytophthora palmivora]|uniref:Pol protein n=1 Tax=Phytophthora palmivora TaxID=4796 RepID=A0A2P4XGN8_9STRA|nr:Pol protein [Phytophthora palmivora]